jgi:hypothetical protein
MMMMNDDVRCSPYHVHVQITAIRNTHTKGPI